MVYVGHVGREWIVMVEYAVAKYSQYVKAGYDKR